MYLRRCGRPSDPHARSFLSGAHGPGGGGQRSVAVRVEAEEAEDEAEEEPRRKRAADGQAGRQAGREGNKGAKKVVAGRQDTEKVKTRQEGSSIRFRARIPSIPYKQPLSQRSQSFLVHRIDTPSLSPIALASLSS